MLKHHEGFRRRPYKDSLGYQTIGIGHNIDAKGLPDDIEAFLEANGYITDEMIDRLLDDDIADASADVKRLYPMSYSFSEARRFALVDFLFNVGITTARTFTNTNKAINEERWDDAANGLLASKYARQVGKRAQTIARMLREG